MPITARDRQQRMDQFAAHCRERRVTATPQRMAVYQELARTCRHPSAEFIHRQIRSRLPSISLDTVYRTLRFFEEQGLIERVGSDGARARFDANTSPHAHFVCKMCGAVSDIPASPDYSIPSPNPKAPYGLIHSVHLEYRGVCRKCNESVHPDLRHID